MDELEYNSIFYNLPIDGIYPANNSNINEITPIFNWNDINKITHYHIQVNDTSDFSGELIADKTLILSEFPSPTFLNSNQTYYWRVRVKTEENEWLEWSEMWNFTINELNESSNIIAPRNMSTIEEITPTFIWPDIQNQLNYHIQISETQNFSGILIADDDTLSIAEYYLSSPLPINKYLVYYWRVRVKNLEGEWLNWSDPWYFNISRLIWSYDTEYYIFSSPALGSDGTIYVGSNDDNLYALNPNGTLKWTFTGNTFDCDPAIGADGTIYIGATDRNLYAINPNGSLKWTYLTNGMLYSSPAIGVDGTIYIGSRDTYLYVINSDGTLKWTYKTEEDVFSSPAIGNDGTIYFGSCDNKLYALNTDGSLKWSFLTNGSIYSSPAIGIDGTVYIGSNDDNLYAINPDGTIKWSFLTNGSIYSSPAIGIDGTIYLGSSDDNLYAINADGSLKWSYLTQGSINSSPAIGNDGTVFVVSYDNKIYAIDSFGLMIWSYSVLDDIESSPVISDDGVIYFGSRDKKIYALYTNCGGLDDSPWPMFHQNPQHTGLQPED